MYSLNVPVPSDVSRLARGIASETITATPRDRHTLVVKRLGDGEPRSLAATLRRRLAGTAPFPVRITGVELFRQPETPPAPVAYLAIDSPPLERLHDRLCASFEPIPGIEGDAYVPHVTVARGGDADRLGGRSVDVEWTVDSLFVWSGRYEESVERIALPP
ncbi:MAG: 2'-5' RNA ligase family protein [Natronomonas sp.]